MSKKAFEGIAQGLREAIAHAKGDSSVTARTRLHQGKGRRKLASPSPADVKTARKQVGLTRDEFANAFGLSPATLRKWENGERHPTGAARALLTIIAREPEAVLRAMQS